MSIAPDFIEPVVGWRVWVVGERAKRLELRSVVYNTAWPPRGELVAECLRSPSLLPRRWRPAHEPPFARCKCGIYATSEPEQLVEYFDGFSRFELRRVFGRVFLWGTVVSCERGWRASHAYPAHLYVPELNAGPARRPRVDEITVGLGRYGVPVEIFGCETRYELARALAGTKDHA